MIISQTPLRVSFFGGSTDIRDYYRQNGGAVLSTTIDKYIYVIVKSRYDEKIVLNYSEKETVSDINLIKHQIFREALRISNIQSAVEITSLADIPSEGSGLGSSSAFTVGLLNALYAYKGEYLDQARLAELACHIEIEVLREPIGKQDQYAAAYGGFRNFIFNPDDSVIIKKINISSQNIRLLNMSSLLFFTGMVRKSAAILREQHQNTGRNLEKMNCLKELALSGKDFIVNADIAQIAQLLDINWKLKKSLGSNIDNDEISHIYSLAKASGALGGKLLGAGGGGFFLFICPPEKQPLLRETLHNYYELSFRFEPYGSRIILNIKDSSGFIKPGG